MDRLKDPAAAIVVIPGKVSKEIVKWKREEITFEVDQTTTIRSRGRARVSWCAACGGRVLMLSADDAVQLTALDTRAIYRLIEIGQLHFEETSAGSVRVCLNSLRRSQQQEASEFRS